MQGVRSYNLRSVSLCSVPGASFWFHVVVNSSKCLWPVWYTEKETYHNRSKETLIQQHLFKAGSFYSPRDNPFQYNDLSTGPITSPTTPIRLVLLNSWFLPLCSVNCWVMTSPAAIRTPKAETKSNEELNCLCSPGRSTQLLYLALMVNTIKHGMVPGVESLKQCTEF